MVFYRGTELGSHLPSLQRSALPGGHSWLDPRVAQQGPTPHAHFQPLLPGFFLSFPNLQEEQNEGLHFCFLSRATSLQCSQEALQHLLSAVGSSVLPLLLSSAPRPVFRGWLAHTTCRISSQNPTAQPKAQRMAPWLTARQKESSKPCAPATDPILPSLPAATNSLCHWDRPLQCLTVTAAKLTLHAGGSCPGARVSARCTGCSALPYGVRLPSRAINTTAGKKATTKGSKAVPFCAWESPPWAGGAKACRGEVLHKGETLTAEKQEQKK